MNNTHVIVGTAGHVDHGKTCLIKALTGKDTDRLEEEKRRGITIELGFADMPNDRGQHIGIIDVPGHEKFVKNMLAGIGGIDLVLLVIGADEGVMPQTVEHFEILKMLEIKKGIVVLTKCDLVDEEWMEIVKEDAVDLVKGTFLEGMPLLEVSSYTGYHIPELKTLICDMVATCEERNTDAGMLRIPVDRVFTIDGFGTVITGTLMQGTCTTGSEVEIYPQGKIAKVRSVQVHGETVEQAIAGQRTAINLTGIKKEEVHRGHVIGAVGSLETTMMVDVKLKLFTDTKRSLLNGSRLHVYYGSDEVLCKAILLEEDSLESGQEGYAQLRLERAIAIKKGDRFIIRFYSPVETIGGGVILDANPQKHKRFHRPVLDALQVKEQGTPKELLEQVIRERSSQMVPLTTIIVQLGMKKEDGERICNELLDEHKILPLSREWMVHETYVEWVAQQSEKILEDYHHIHSMSPGMPKEEYRNRLGDTIYCKDGKAVELLIRTLTEKRSILDSGNVISSSSFKVAYTEEQKKLRETMKNVYRAAGYEVPELETVMALHKDKNWIKAILEELCQSGVLVKLVYPYYMDGQAFAQGVQLLKEHIQKNGTITLGEFRDLLGTSRKYAVLFLEVLDERNITRKVNDARILN